MRLLSSLAFDKLSLVRVYLDLCCLKRPFDLQEQPIIRLQTEAVLSILALPSDTVELLQSPALVLENSLNPNPVDLQLLRLAARVSDELHVAVIDPIYFIEEISQWKH